MEVDHLTAVNGFPTGTDTGEGRHGWQSVEDWNTLAGFLVEVHHRRQLVDVLSS